MMKLFVHESEGSYREATIDEVLAGALGALARRYRRGAALSSPKTVRELCQIKLADLPHEVFCVIWLDNRHRLIEFEELFRGTIDGASVHPREVVKSGLAHNAAACILTHCHPSGVAEPSDAYQLITRRLKDALGLVEIRVLDHVVVGGEGSVSFAERGLI